MREQWKKMDQFKKDDCYISNLGNIAKNGNSCMPSINCQGYEMFKGKLVHHLVLNYFNKIRPNGFVCDHIDLNKSNNKLDNLEWVSRAENTYRSTQIRRPFKRDGKRVYTIRNISNETYKSLKIKAAENETSINKTILKAIDRYLFHTDTPAPNDIKEVIRICD